jgi:thiol:disulfide interchange protein DsbD
VLGGLVLWFAYLYLSKALEIFGLSPDSCPAIAVALVVLFLSAFFLQTAVEDVQTRTLRALAGVGAVIGSTVLFHQLQPVGPRSAAPPGGTGVAPPSVEIDGDLTWFLNEEAAYAKAGERGRVVFIDFYGSWCTNCKEFSRLTREDQALRAALRHAVLLKVYDSSPVFEKYLKDPRFPELKVGLPFFVITDAKGNLLYKTNDYLKTDEMILFLTP